MRKAIGRAAAVLLLFYGAASATTLYSVGPDELGIPRNLFALSESPLISTPVLVTGIGDQTLGFNGGLVWDSAASRFYAVANDSDGNGTLVWFTTGTASSVTNVLSLTPGVLWTGGLTLGPGGAFYAIGTDAGTGVAALYELGSSVTWIANLGNGSLGFNGGLAWDGTYFEAIANDSSLNSEAVRISTSGELVGVPLGIGAGYLGGLVYYPAGGVFYALCMDASFNDYLYTISVEDFGGSVAQVYQLSGASGFWNAGLALESDQGQTPEPATPGLALLGVACLLAIARKGRTYDKA